MSFKEQLNRLKEAALMRQPGRRVDLALVYRKDLTELIYHFDRLDQEERARYKPEELKGTGLIFRERQRQIEQEGWTEEHDQEHRKGELALAAACYAIPTEKRTWYCIIEKLWPWSNNWWKSTPNDRIRELTKAGALIAAEIDRLISEGEKS
ncbi:hypothetical protein [Pelosinus sp. IPA-1]|uniref:hypothetical protein n=1 Tax=Pelosinus sp. IPA-1 TaxID=3029569 RepID=UPI0024361B12|nr:hypothetical protein [Pelosinus sp. IPA-1]GMB00413.1 hypothetical protein PIPA1_32120 [Pelosinus sp. IPA-1]